MLQLEQLTLQYKEKIVLSRVDHRFEDGRITALLGASGIGKTSLLHALAGLTKPTEGRILSTYERPAYLFQDVRLFPWMTALENVTAVCPDTVAASALLTRLFPGEDVLSLYPRELSGGMKQRVAIARTLAYDSDLLLLDEPFRGLDPDTRGAVRDLILEKAAGKTVILVTHDGEDLAFCDTALRMVGSPVTALLPEKSGTSRSE